MLTPAERWYGWADDEPVLRARRWEPAAATVAGQAASTGANGIVLAAGDAGAPDVVATAAGGAFAFYRRAVRGEGRSLYLRYASVARAPGAVHPEAAFAATAEAWERARPRLNPGCWYSKWNAEYELERKWTLAAGADVWRLARAVYDDVAGAAVAGFVPEFGDEFQIWDYENVLFEVLEPREARGYISFIPQADGRTTVKRKIFERDAELRRERLTGDVVLRGSYEETARELTGAQVRALPPCRRKRVDVNIESLESGHVYGIFFDVSRLVDDPGVALVQCELEYLRSRTLAAPPPVEPEFERLAAYVATVLAAQSVGADQSPYSKLSFLRDAVAARAGSAAR